MTEQYEPVRDAASDCIIVFPYSANIGLVDGQPQARLSVLSQMAIDAAVSVWQQRKAADLLVVGETTFGPEYPTTAELMAQRAESVPASSIVKLDRQTDGMPLNNTNRQTDAVARRLARRALPYRATVLALDFHVPRVALRCRRRGIVANYLSVEAALESADNHQYDDLMPALRRFRSSERLLYATSRVDNGWLLNRLTDWKGPRVMDIEPTDTGYQLVRTTATDRLAELRLSQLDASANS